MPQKPKTYEESRDELVRASYEGQQILARKKIFRRRLALVVTILCMAAIVVVRTEFLSRDISDLPTIELAIYGVVLLVALNLLFLVGHDPFGIGLDREEADRDA